MEEEKTYPYTKLGLRVKKVRKALKKIQGELAADLEIHRSKLSKIEHGQMFFNLNSITNLHVKHKVNLNWLLTGSGEMFVKEPKPASNG